MNLVMTTIYQSTNGRHRKRAKSSVWRLRAAPEKELTLLLRKSCRFLPKERTSTYIRQKPPNHPILIEDESPKATEIDELPIRTEVPPVQNASKQIPAQPPPPPAKDPKDPLASPSPATKESAAFETRHRQKRPQHAFTVSKMCRHSVLLRGVPPCATS